jgi:CRP-like cAMP-binding protein
MDDFTAMIFAGAESLELPPGAFLFHAQDIVRSMFLVEEGEISLERVQDNGQITCFQRAEVGDVLAEASAYAQKYHCDARVVQNVRVRRIGKAYFKSQLRKDPALADAWASQLARAVHKARLIGEIRSFKAVSDRLDAWLDEVQELPPKGQWQSLAHEIAVSPEALYRELAKRRN